MGMVPLFSTSLILLSPITGFVLLCLAMPVDATNKILLIKNSIRFSPCTRRCWLLMVGVQRYEESLKIGNIC
jgi:hypothetical protein